MCIGKCQFHFHVSSSRSIHHLYDSTWECHYTSHQTILCMDQPEETWKNFDHLSWLLAEDTHFNEFHWTKAHNLPVESLKKLARKSMYVICCVASAISKTQFQTDIHAYIFILKFIYHFEVGLLQCVVSYFWWGRGMEIWFLHRGRGEDNRNLKLIKTQQKWWKS